MRVEMGMRKPGTMVMDTTPQARRAARQVPKARRKAFWIVASCVGCRTSRNAIRGHVAPAGR